MRHRVEVMHGVNFDVLGRQPAAVLVDPSALETLPREELSAGYAEVVKTALIAGGGLWARVRQGGPVGAREIMGCVRTKLEVVAEDERDGGRRQVLNLGHTVGHAIETASGMLHGEAVALGLLAACRVSAAVGPSNCSGSPWAARRPATSSRRRSRPDSRSAASRPMPIASPCR